MLSKIKRWFIGIIVSIFCGIGIGASMVFGAAGLSNAKIDTLYIPFWIDYALLYGGLIAFILGALFLIYKCVIGIIKQVRHLRGSPTT